MQPIFDKDRTCCFTGHRHIPPSDIPKLTACMEETVEILIQRSFDTFISGGALGFDTLAAETVLRLKKKHPHIRLVMALPCRNQQIKWSPYQQNKYNNILAQSDELIYLSEEYHTGCMHLRNRYMIDNSGLCIAYMTRSGGGTSYTVRYAESQEVETVNIAYLII